MKTVELEGFDKNSSKIPFAQILSLFFLAFPFLSLIIKFLFTILFPQFSSAKQTSSEITFLDYSEYNKSVPLAIIDFHTSRTTFYRIIYFYENYWKNNSLLNSNLFKIRIIYSDLFDLNSNFFNNSKINIQLNPVKCLDTIFNLSCRVDSSYKSFLDDPENKNIGYLYRATDDSYINFENLYYYIINLNQNYDPTNDLIVRAHANFERKSNYYIHGGPGYLMSREYVKYHFLTNLTLSRLQNYSKYKQDDTAESIIVRKIFSGSYKQWDEFYIEGFKCQNCELTKNSNNTLPKCPPNRRIGVLNKIISLHMFGLNENQNIFLKLIQNLNKKEKSFINDIRYYNDDDTQSFLLCKSKYGKTEEFNFNHHKRIKISNLKNPLINFKKLQPEYLYSYLFEV